MAHCLNNCRLFRAVTSWGVAYFIFLCVAISGCAHTDRAVREHYQVNVGGIPAHDKNRVAIERQTARSKPARPANESAIGTGGDGISNDAADSPPDVGTRRSLPLSEETPLDELAQRNELPEADAHTGNRNRHQDKDSLTLAAKASRGEPGRATIHRIGQGSQTATPNVVALVTNEVSSPTQRDRMRADELIAKSQERLNRGLRDDALRIAMIAERLEQSQRAHYADDELRPSQFISQHFPQKDHSVAIASRDGSALKETPSVEQVRPDSIEPELIAHGTRRQKTVNELPDNDRLVESPHRRAPLASSDERQGDPTDESSTLPDVTIPDLSLDELEELSVNAKRFVRAAHRRRAVVPVDPATTARFVAESRRKNGLFDDPLNQLAEPRSPLETPADLNHADRALDASSPRERDLAAGSTTIGAMDSNSKSASFREDEARSDSDEAGDTAVRGLPPRKLTVSVPAPNWEEIKEKDLEEVLWLSPTSAATRRSLMPSNWTWNQVSSIGLLTGLSSLGILWIWREVERRNHRLSRAT